MPSIDLTMKDKQNISVGSRGAVVRAALSDRKVAGSIPTIGDFHTVGPCKTAAFACLATDVEQDTFTVKPVLSDHPTVQGKMVVIDRWSLRARSHCIKIVRFCIEGFRRIVCITVTLLFWVSLVVILLRAWRGT